MSDPNSFKEGLARLGAEFAGNLPARLGEIAATRGTFVAAEVDARAAGLKELAGLAHRLAGSAGMYGYPELGAAARALNDEGKAMLNDGAPLDARAVERIAGLVDRMMASAGDAAPSGAPVAPGSGTDTARASPPARPETRSAVWDRYLRVPGLIYVPALLVALGILFAGVYADRLNARHFSDNQRTAVSDKLAADRGRLEGYIYSNISLVKGLSVMIGLEPDMSAERFAALAAPLLLETGQLRNISAAPGLVIRYVYPLKGNEGVLGFDIGSHPIQRAAALRARDTGEIVLAGPVDLVQGGQGFIGRFPVFVERGPGQRKAFWGVIAAVIDAKRLYDAVGFLDDRRSIEIAIRGKDGLGSKGELFYGRAEVFESDPILASVALPDGTWQMAAIPRGGWPARADDAWTLRLGFLLGGSLIVLSLGFATWLFRRRLESLAALTTSEARFRDLTEISSDWIWETGPDGRFTYLSDGFTHLTGHPKEILLGKTREEGFIVHVPGDEAIWKNHKRSIAERRPIRELRYRYRRPDGSIGWTVVQGNPIFAADGSFQGYRGAAREITQRMREEQDLRESKLMADAANRAKSDFLSNMSHELRTPLNAILGFGQLLKYNPKEPLTERQAENVDIILKGGQHLLTLITEILDLAKIESGKATLSIENVSIGTLLGEVRSLVEPLASKSGIALDMTAPEPDVAIRADYTRAKQVLLNLASNAVKYNFEGGRVTVRAFMVPGGKLRLSVADTGPGIPRDKHAELFQPFSRLGAETTAIEGTGIGLALSKKLVEIMGGAIGFESEIGVGSTFWVEFPLARRPAVAAIKARFSGAEEKQGVEFPALRGTILYVEDNPDNLKFMEMICSYIEGVTLWLADNAERGLSIAAERKPDVIIMDINLPGMNGFEALECLKRDERTCAIPVVALSANATARDIERGARSGFFRYLTKPADVSQLLNTIREAMDSRR